MVFGADYGPPREEVFHLDSLDTEETLPELHTRPLASRVTRFCDEDL